MCGALTLSHPVHVSLPDYEYQASLVDLLWRSTLNKKQRKTLLTHALTDGGKKDTLEDTVGLFLNIKNATMETVKHHLLIPSHPLHENESIDTIG